MTKAFLWSCAADLFWLPVPRVLFQRLDALDKTATEALYIVIRTFRILDRESRFRMGILHVGKHIMKVAIGNHDSQMEILNVRKLNMKAYIGNLDSQLGILNVRKHTMKVTIGNLTPFGI